MATLSKTTLILGALGLIGVSGAAATFITINVIEKPAIESTDAPAEAVPEKPKEIVQTVDWYKNNPAARKEMVKKCANNPGELSTNANCINAKQASVRDTSGGLIRFGD